MVVHHEHNTPLDVFDLTVTALQHVCPCHCQTPMFDGIAHGQI
jgi:hypothetical protein